MELYTLNLRKSIRYETAGEADWTSVHAAAAGLSDRDELLAVLDGETLVHSDDNGPHAADPLPAPLAAGRKSATMAGSELHEGPELREGAYLFAQGRYDDADSVPALLDWFVREAWWQREASEGPYYIRWVREDGKTALQVLRKKR